MQFFVQDVREWGNRKIFSCFAQSADAENAFFERMRLQNMMLADCKSTAFSLPRMYKFLHERIKSRYFGMESFMLNCEPMIMTLDLPGKSVQRRFKNQWDACWGSFGKSVASSPETIIMLRELGVRMCFSANFDALPDELFLFYNTILKWYVFTSSEGALMETGLSPTELIERMIMRDAELFVHDIEVGF